MLNGRNIVCISVPPWKGEYAATIVELMKVFGRTNTVLYVQNPFTIKDFLTAILQRRRFPYRQAIGLSSRINKASSGSGSVYVMIPPVLLTINFLKAGWLYNFLAKFNGRILRNSVRRHLRKLRMTDQLIQVVAFNPALGVFTGRQFNERLLLYHCYDEIGEAQWMKKHGAEAEAQFIRMADATIVTSQGLLEKKQRLASRCFLVKNAADIQLFSTAFREHAPSKQVAGYIGSLDNRLDYDLLVHVARSMPHVTFQFIGRIADTAGTNRLRELPNVILTGPKDLADLPAFVRQFSAGLIPFVLNDFTKGIYPLKINEYLAAGIPVVTTHFSYLDDFTGHISIAGNATQFGEMLAAEMASDSPAKKIARQQSASGNTWESRAEQLSGIIVSLENGKENGLKSIL